MRPETQPTARTLRGWLALLALLALAASSLALGACGRVEGGQQWRDALHAQKAPAPGPAADEVYPVPAPPFTKGIFPCSRCHEGGEPAKDALPAIPHKLHVSRGLECADCHSPEDAEADPTIPAREVCNTCHGDPRKLSDGARAYFAAVTAADGSTNFPRRWASRDLLFQHGRHMKAGVECAACHGEPADAPFAKPKPVTLMDRCVACHEERAKPVTCETCHRETTAKAHANIVLHHAEENRGCLDCHDAEDRDRLRLANGAKITFEESFKLCGQCHGTQFRDWKIGLHGRRTGSWNGRREYRLCVHCHYPHEPRFKPMDAVAMPLRPDEVR